MGRNILCDKYKEGKFPPSLKCDIISGKAEKSVIRNRLKFKDFVSILSSTLTQAMTSEK